MVSRGGPSLSASLGSQPGDYAAVRVVVRGSTGVRSGGCIYDDPLLCLATPLLPGNLLIPQAGPDPPVTRAPDHLAPLSYWLSFQPPVSLTAGATSTWLCAVLPAPADHRTLGERTEGVEAAGCCVSALMGHQLVRALSQDGCRLVQESV